MGKRMQALATKVDKTKNYSLDEAVALIKETSNTKFDSTVEVHVRLGIDPKKSDQQIRATVALPHGTGKTKKIAAFVGPNDEKVARETGADVIYMEEDLKRLKDTGKIDFEIAIATPEMMPKMALVAKVLGPKGLMPSPKTETVGTDVKKIINELKKGKTSFKNDDGANVHVGIGKASFSVEQLKENVTAFIEVLRKIKPNSSKGTYIKALYLTSSMGPSVKVSVE